MRLNTKNISQVLEITQINDVYIQIHAERYIIKELWQHFSFLVPGYQFMPAFKNKMWDGNIHLFNAKDRTLYAGLLSKVIQFAKENDYNIMLGPSVRMPKKIDLEVLTEFIKTLSLPFEVRNYQLDAIHQGIQMQRSVLVSPTGSGKSLMIYILARWFDVKTLIVVPTTSLVSQLHGDFKDYSVNSTDWNHEEHIHKIYEGSKKPTEKKITISTWQAIFRQKEEFFADFGMVVIDEAHLTKAKSLSSILEKMKYCPIRFGTTGTIDERGSSAHPLVITGLLGSIYKVTKTKTLIKEGFLAGFKVDVIALNYSDSDKKANVRKTYQEEIDWVVRNPYRNMFILDLVTRLKGNTLVIYNYVEKHGIPLHELFKEKAKNHKTHFISGSVGADDREEIRRLIEKSDNNIIIGSYGTVSTGINYKNLHNIVFVSPSKSMIRVLQSIGRVLRKTETKLEATLYDIVDDLSTESRKNYLFEHGVERLKIYINDGFNYSHRSIDFQKIQELYEKKSEK